MVNKTIIMVEYFFSPELNTLWYSRGKRPKSEQTAMFTEIKMKFLNFRCLGT